MPQCATIICHTDGALTGASRLQHAASSGIGIVCWRHYWPTDWRCTREIWWERDWGRGTAGGIDTACESDAL